MQRSHSEPPLNSLEASAIAKDTSELLGDPDIDSFLAKRRMQRLGSEPTSVQQVQQVQYVDELAISKLPHSHESPQTINISGTQLEKQAMTEQSLVDSVHNITTAHVSEQQVYNIVYLFVYWFIVYNLRC